MTPQEYLIASERTEKKFPIGMTIESDVRMILKNLTDDANAICEGLDHIKRHLIYGANNEIDMGNSEFLPPGFVIDQRQAEFLHAALGKMTEAEEFFSAVMGHILEGKDLDETNLFEELGDGWWYDAIVLRLIKRSFEEGMGTNIGKLKARFPDKFSSESALVRDLGAERDVLVEGHA